MTENESKKTRKLDRRSAYTKKIIKDSLLELLHLKDFNDIHISALCKQAEITRSTFYSHYDNLSAVVDELVDEALEIARHKSLTMGIASQDNMEFLSNLTLEEFKKNELRLPACQRLADDPKYKILFQNQGLSNYCIHRIYQAEKDTFIKSYMKKTNLTEQEADYLYINHVYGAFFMNQAMGWKKDDTWYKLHHTMICAWNKELQSL